MVTSSSTRNVDTHLPPRTFLSRITLRESMEAGTAGRSFTLPKTPLSPDLMDDVCAALGVPLVDFVRKFDNAVAVIEGSASKHKGRGKTKDGR